MKSFSLHLFFMLAAVAPGICSACPGAEPATDIPPRLFWELGDWIAGQTDYDVIAMQASPPTILTCIVGDTITYEGEEILVGEDLRGAYSLPDRTIFLVSPWSHDSIEDRARLLHELIHDVQFQNARWPCPQAAEAEAYRLTADWLAEQGVTPAFNWFAIHLLSRCPNDIHP